MFNHIMVGATDIEASKKFYDATLGVFHLYGRQAVWQKLKNSQKTQKRPF